MSDDDLVGPDTIDLPERQRIQDLFDRDDEEVAANEWPGVIRDVLALARETRDLWVAVRLAEGGARAGRLDVVEDGARLLAGLLEAFWDEVHPKLEDVDFEGRANTCASLTKIRDFLGPLRRTPLFVTRIGSFSADDLERFDREGDGAEGYGMFRVALNQLQGNGELETTAQATIDRLDGIRDSIRSADAVLTDNSGSSTSTNFQPTYVALEAMRRLLVPHAGQVTGGEEDEASDTDPGHAVGAMQGGASAGGPRIGGRVESREDVLKALDAIGDYYRTREPASPVPVLLNRARQWVGMDFIEVLADLVPGSVDDAKQVLMTRADRAASDDDGY